MNSIKSSKKYQWKIIEGRLEFYTNESIISVSGADIVRIEFKNQKVFNGIEISEKPSEKFEGLKINRFPAKLKLELKMPVNITQKPLLNILVYSENFKSTLEVLPVNDQIIVESKWFPLVKDNIEDIKTILKNCKIDRSGAIPLRKSLDLILTKSEYITVSESDESYSEKEEKHLFTDLQKTLTFAGFTANLYPYQQTGVSWLYSLSEEGLGCILADEMGLGKTVQIIALLTIYKEKWGLPSIIIVPATVLENWRREFVKFSGNMEVLVHIGSLRTGFPSIIKKYDIIVTSYDTAVRDQGMLAIINWGFVILDEAQAIKNPDTRRAIGIKTFKSNISIAVSGTPVENRLRDLWSIMDFSCPGLLGTQNTFESNYADTERSATRLEQIVSPLILRRKIANVADDLPEKIIIPQVVDMSNEEVSSYEELRQNIFDKYGRSATLVSLIKLRQFCTHPSILEENPCVNPELISKKYVRMIEILEEILAQDQKAIIFTSFLKMSDLMVLDLKKRLGVPCYQIDGRTPGQDRQGKVDFFSNLKGSAILILNPRAVGTGVNITAANHVIHFNLEWNPAVEDQATARAYRLGQVLPVTVHRLFYPNTIEEVINDRIERKRNLADTAVVGTEAAEANVADIARALSISPANTQITQQ